MALFQPTNIIPSTLSGEGNGTIDVTEPLSVSWQVNGNSPMTAYQIRIMQNDTASTEILDTGKVSVSPAFYGSDALGNPKNFTAIISVAQMATAGMTNGYANGYKLSIKQWWTADDYIEQTSASFFITRSIPSVTMGIIPYRNSFRMIEYTFESYYSQAQNDSVEWARWELQAMQGGEYVTIDDTGNIYHPGMIAQYYYNVLQYTYDGFATGIEGFPGSVGVQYRLKCTVQTENGVQADTGWEEFTTQSLSDWPQPATLGLCVTKDTDAVKITMPKNFPILGESTGEFDYTRGTTKYNLNLHNSGAVTWGGSGTDSLDINESPYYIAVKGRVSDTSSANAFLTADYETKALTFSYDSNGFYIRLSGQEIWRTSITPIADATVGIAILEDSVYFLQKSNGAVQSENTPISAWQRETMNAITVHGPMVFEYVFAFSGRISWIYFYNQMTSDYTSVSQEPETLFLATFDYTLYTGSVDIGASGTSTDYGGQRQITNALAIYRKAASSVIFEKVVRIPLNKWTKDTVIWDYAATNMQEYEYYLLFLWDSNYIRSRNGIGKITPCFWNYTVLCCSQNNLGDYIVEKEYRFALDVSSGSAGNNNTPVLQQNFTRYPLRQPASGNYRSGTLSAFIGKVENDQYVDTVNLMDELYGLSTNGLTKFLKTRKGQIFQIETSAPVSMQIGDKYAKQPAKISLPWVETGDASSANILGDSGMILDTPTFHVDMETMELIMTYNAKSAMGEDSFALSDQDLYLLNPGNYDDDDFTMNSNKEVILNTD